jgi:hypothetical protein
LASRSIKVAVLRWDGSLATNGLAGRSGKITSLPPRFNAWTNSRDFPRFAREPFRERVKWHRADEVGVKMYID